MKTQSNTTAGSGKKSRPSMQFHLPANGQHPHSASGQQMSAARDQSEFTIEEHLRVQQEIEERAHRLWLAQGGVFKSAISYWLQAEDEVLAEFFKKRLLCDAGPPAVSGSHTKTGGTSLSRTATPHASSAISKPKLTAADQPTL